MDRPRGSALPLLNVLHDVRCQKLPVLLLRGPRVILFFGLLGRRIGPGGWYLTYPGHNNPDFFQFFFFSHWGWLPVMGWYRRERWYRTSNTVAAVTAAQ